MDKSNNEEFRREIENLSYKYIEFENEYNLNKKNDEDMTEYVTQPFWQSMFLAKRRLNKKEIVVKSSYEKEKEHKYVKSTYNTNIASLPLCSQGIDVESDKDNEAGFLIRKVKSRHIYEKNHKIIHKEKDNEIIQMSVIRSKINENGEVPCFNCGYVGTIASFIDGCDACGSKYTVNDFNPKVSSFFVDENTNKKIRKSFSSVYKVMLYVILISIALVVASLFVFNGDFQIKLGDAVISYDNKEGLLVLGLILFVTTIMSLFQNSIILAIVASIFSKSYSKMFENENVVKNIYDNFSLYDFFQKIEYKIRNIHFAENQKELESYIQIDASRFIEKYKNVIDCSMAKLKFLSAENTGNGYSIKAKAKIRLVLCVGNKIKTKYENVNFIAYGRKGVVDKKITALREYKCPTCSSSINVIKGATCEYCGNVYDYGDYDWVISNYEIEHKNPINIHKAIRIIVPIIFISVYLISQAQYVYVLSDMFIDDGINYEQMERYDTFSEMYYSDVEEYRSCDGTIVVGATGYSGYNILIDWEIVQGSTDTVYNDIKKWYEDKNYCVFSCHDNSIYGVKSVIIENRPCVLSLEMKFDGNAIKGGIITERYIINTVLDSFYNILTICE